MPEQTSVIILGAGPSGLAAAACLREKGVPFIVLERAGEVGSTWRNHYERLHLHTIKQFSALPGLPWPATVPMYPSREEVVLEYLERLLYAPYPLQEEALYAWAACADGLLLSAPTGTGKTLAAFLSAIDALLRQGAELPDETQVLYVSPLRALRKCV